MIPKQIAMRATLFGDGENGYSMQTHSNEEYGVFVTAIRDKHGEPFVQSWTSYKTGEDVFDSFEELRAAYNAAEDRQETK